MNEAIPIFFDIIAELVRYPETNPADRVHFRAEVHRKRKREMVRTVIAEFESQGKWEDARWLIIHDATALVLEDRHDEAREILEGLLESDPPLTVDSLARMALTAQHLNDYSLLARIILQSGITTKSVAELQHQMYLQSDLARLAFLCQVKGELPRGHGDWDQTYQQLEQPMRNVYLSKRQVTEEELSALDLPPDLEEFISNTLTE